MALIFADRVKETTTTTGTGTLSLAGAVTGFQDFDAVMADSDTCYYALQGVDGSGVPTGEWEVGLGTFTSGSPDTLARTTVIASSNGGAAVNLSAGTKEIWQTVPAVRFPTDLGKWVEIGDTTVSGATAVVEHTFTASLYSMILSVILGASHDNGSSRGITSDLRHSGGTIQSNSSAAVAASVNISLFVMHVIDTVSGSTRGYGGLGRSCDSAGGGGIFNTSTTNAASADRVQYYTVTAGNLDAGRFFTYGLLA